VPGGRSEAVDELVAKAGPRESALAQKLRRLIREALPGAEEVVKWGNPTYLVDGKPVAWLLLYGDHINLGFFQGSKLKSRRLEGTGKRLRHVKVRASADVDEVEFSRLLREAAMIGRGPVNK